MIKVICLQSDVAALEEADFVKHRPGDGPDLITPAKICLDFCALKIRQGNLDPVNTVITSRPWARSYDGVYWVEIALPYFEGAKVKAYFGGGDKVRAITWAMLHEIGLL